MQATFPSPNLAAAGRAGRLLLALLLLALALPAVAEPATDPSEAALAYLRAHPHDFSLVSAGVRPDGTLDPAGLTISLRPDERIPLGSTVKILVLAAYAREVAAGRVSPAETVTLADWEDYYLPLSDGGAHPAALQELGIATDPYGFALDPAAAATLDDLARAMIAFSDNAATDLLHHRLGAAAVRSTMAELGLAGQDPPLSILGIFLSWSNHETGPLSAARLARLRRLSRTRYEAEVARLEAAYQDPQWRRQELRFLAGTGDSPRYDLEARAAEITYPQGTARGYAQVMARVLAGNLLSPAASAVMRRHLDLPLPNAEVFEVVGQKGGSLAGILTVATYAVPAAGELAHQRRVTVLLLHRIPPRDLAAMVDTLAPVYFALRLDGDADFARRAASLLTP